MKDWPHPALFLDTAEECINEARDILAQMSTEEEPRRVDELNQLAEKHLSVASMIVAKAVSTLNVPQTEDPN